MSHSPSLETSRLTLRPIAAEDADEWWAAIWSDAEVTRYLPPREPLPPDAIRMRVERAVDHWDAHGIGIWAAREKTGARLVGHCGLVVNEPPDVELIYAFARQVWNQGLATEASGRLVAFAFEDFGVDRVVALVFPENVASCRVLEKLGFVQRGEAERFGATLRRFILNG